MVVNPCGSFNCFFICNKKISHLLLVLLIVIAWRQFERFIHNNHHRPLFLPLRCIQPLYYPWWLQRLYFFYVSFSLQIHQPIGSGSLTITQIQTFGTLCIELFFHPEPLHRQCLLPFHVSSGVIQSKCPCRTLVSWIIHINHYFSLKWFVEILCTKHAICHHRNGTICTLHNFVLLRPI